MIIHVGGHLAIGAYVYSYPWAPECPPPGPLSLFFFLPASVRRLTQLDRRTYRFAFWFLNVVRRYLDCGFGTKYKAAVLKAVVLAEKNHRPGDYYEIHWVTNGDWQTRGSMAARKEGYLFARTMVQTRLHQPNGLPAPFRYHSYSQMSGRFHYLHSRILPGPDGKTHQTRWSVSTSG